MFYEGTLQSGIGQAIQQQKLVACFIRDDSATSKQWEDEWLRSGWLSSLLEQKAILLRLESGSTEAGFLAAFCKIESAPTLVVIHNGKLQLQLGSEVGQDEFVNAVRKVLGAAPIPGSAPAQASTSQAEDDLYGDDEAAVATTPVSVPVASAASAPAPVAPAPAPAPATPPAPSPARTPVSATRSTASNKGKQRAEAAPQAGLAASSSTTNSAQAAARAALQKKKREDAEELARVKARIEQDKAERRAAAEARKAEREQERTQNTQSPAQPTLSSTRGSQAPIAQLSVRLFDGRTIRSPFPRTATLESEVRHWIDSEFANLPASDPNLNTAHRSLPPYFFRHILAPQPSRELSARDEAQQLGDIDLAPSATLVLVPVKGYSDAYGGSSGTNLLAGTTTGLVSGAFGLLSSTVGYAGGIIGSFLGTGSQSQSQSQGQSQGQTVGGGASASTSPSENEAASANRNRNAGQGGGGGGSTRSESQEQAGIRVRTLADQRAREPRTQQFYNGNQSNVEPRPDDRG